MVNHSSFIPKYVPLERLPVPRPCDRLNFIKRQALRQNVLDLGAMDETAYLSKRGLGGWLHEELASVATRVVGIDSSTLVPPDGLVTTPNSMIFRGDVSDLSDWVPPISATNEFIPDLVVAGELIEHLPNPLDFLKSLRRNPHLSGKTVILTTPNATAMHNCLVGLASRESTHHDHLCILSFKTLTTLLHRAGYEEWTIQPYYSQFPEMKQRQRGLGAAFVAGAERVINGAEWLFPILSFGWIAVAKINDEVQGKSEHNVTNA